MFEILKDLRCSTCTPHKGDATVDGENIVHVTFLGDARWLSLEVTLFCVGVLLFFLGWNVICWNLLIYYEVEQNMRALSYRMCYIMWLLCTTAACFGRPHCFTTTFRARRDAMAGKVVAEFLAKGSKEDATWHDFLLKLYQKDEVNAFCIDVYFL